MIEPETEIISINWDGSVYNLTIHNNQITFIEEYSSTEETVEFERILTDKNKDSKVGLIHTEDDIYILFAYEPAKFKSEKKIISINIIDFGEAFVVVDEDRHIIFFSENFYHKMKLLDNETLDHAYIRYTSPIAFDGYTHMDDPTIPITIKRLCQYVTHYEYYYTKSSDAAIIELYPGEDRMTYKELVNKAYKLLEQYSVQVFKFGNFW